MAKPPEALGSFEQFVLLALLRLGKDAYGMTVRQELTERTGRDVSLGAVYSTLDRLERKGLVSSHAGTSSAARGGRARRFFRVEAKGTRALQHTLRTLDELRQGLGGLQPGAATT